MSFSADSLFFKKMCSNLSEGFDLINVYCIWIWILQ